MVRKEDLWDKSLVFGVYVLTKKNINPFSLERKIFDVKNKEMINMFWEDCNEPSFYKHICKPDNFLYLNDKNVIYPRVADIVWKYLEQDEQTLARLEKKLRENKKLFQFVYSSDYPEIYSFVEKRGVNLRNNFHLKFKELKDKNKYSQKSIDGYFSKSEGSTPPLGALQRKLVMDEDFEREKILQMNKRKKRLTRKSKKTQRTEVKNCSKK